MSAETGVREHPILFSGEMVRAILAGRKTQTRRIVKPQPPERYVIARGMSGQLAAFRMFHHEWKRDGWIPHPDGYEWTCPYGVPGDRLWVRETFRTSGGGDKKRAVYRCDDAVSPWHPHEGCIPNTDWRPSIHMPRWASRLTLDVTDVRVQRLQEITEEDAIAEGLRSQEGDGGAPGAGYKWRGVGYEGARPGYFHIPGERGRCGCNVADRSPAQCAYRELWDSINGKRGYGWDKNPWVWCLTFRRAA